MQDDPWRPRSQLDVSVDPRPRWRPAPGPLPLSPLRRHHLRV